MDAYQILPSLTDSKQIDENRFNQLKKAFVESYLKDKNYEERLELHRNPMEVKNELLSDLNKYLLQIQRREEMQDIDVEKRASGNVPAKITEIWDGDKRLTSYYEALERYCEQKSKNFNTIAVHMAEYQALFELFDEIQQSKHSDLPSFNGLLTGQTPVGKTVHPLNFENLGWHQFEWLVFAYVSRLKSWDKIEWLGQAGGDSGRDIWGEYNGKSHCYQCANYWSLELKKVKEDIDKLVKANIIPYYFTVVCGGRVTANMRIVINNYAAQYRIKETAIWSAPELEEKLRTDAPDLIKRFFEGEAFPNVPKNDNEIIQLLAECFDRPAFTTPFHREVNIPHFEKAITDTKEVLNTGVHRLRDGTVIRNIPTRHQIMDTELKSQIAAIYKLVTTLRDTFVDLKRKKEIRPCECGDQHCPVYLLSDNACQEMDGIRQSIFHHFRGINANSNLRLEN